MTAIAFIHTFKLGRHMNGVFRTEHSGVNYISSFLPQPQTVSLTFLYLLPVILTNFWHLFKISRKVFRTINRIMGRAGYCFNSSPLIAWWISEQFVWRRGLGTRTKHVSPTLGLVAHELNWVCAYQLVCLPTSNSRKLVVSYRSRLAFWS